jgi:hypothetical protein
VVEKRPNPVFKPPTGPRLGARVQHQDHAVNLVAFRSHHEERDLHPTLPSSRKSLPWTICSDPVSAPILRSTWPGSSVQQWASSFVNQPWDQSLSRPPIRKASRLSKSHRHSPSATQYPGSTASSTPVCISSLHEQRGPCLRQH